MPHGLGLKRRHRRRNGWAHPCNCHREERTASLPLSLIPDGESVRVCCLTGGGSLVRRMAEMGFTPGTVVKVLRHAPLADPVEYQIRGYMVSLRREEASLIRVKPLVGHYHADGEELADLIATSQSED